MGGRGVRYRKQLYLHTASFLKKNPLGILKILRRGASLTPRLYFSDPSLSSWVKPDRQAN
jgi:hypothetical protein